jgi:hypothetical protein
MAFSAEITIFLLETRKFLVGEILRPVSNLISQTFAL